ncbi:uncharacterized protein K02A2.6-like [Phlebotomus papatasi]|uniref:uncharacterized protein K02A2.6-like n=1 Tax=Phlebotomus papatasi TaxID=29031 RepID=UPI0024839995|nr:uncharacterized protein K02A2.6-like [Phlebotomus papatasi]
MAKRKMEVPIVSENKFSVLDDDDDGGSTVTVSEMDEDIQPKTPNISPIKVLSKINNIKAFHEELTKIAKDVHFRSYTNTSNIITYNKVDHDAKEPELHSQSATSSLEEPVSPLPEEITESKQTTDILQEEFHTPSPIMQEDFKDGAPFMRLDQRVAAFPELTRKSRNNTQQNWRSRMAQAGNDPLSGFLTAIEKLIDAKLKEVKPIVPEATSSIPEVSMDALARSIAAFTFSPEDNMTFGVWYSRYKSTFLSDGSNLDDAGRVRLLLRRLDNTAYYRYANLLRPINPADLSFDDNISRLSKLFGKGESLFSLRRKCLQHVMKESEDWAAHGAAINSLCEDFRLGECTPDHFKALIFCISIQSDKHVFVREQLLTCLETEPSNKINLGFLIDEAQRISNMKKDARLDITPANVSAIRKTPSRPSSQSDRPPRPCFLCGGMHFIRDCVHKNTKCQDCDTVGHKTGYCPPKKGQEDSRGTAGKPKKRFFKKKKKASANTYAVFTAHPRGRKFLTPQINGHSVDFQLDCAADVSVVSRSTWEVLGKPNLSEPSVHVKDAQSRRIPIIGEFQCDIVLHGKQARGRCLVSDNAKTNLFGIEWISDLGLWDVAPSAYCYAIQEEIDTTKAVKEIQEAFPDVFGTEIGKCTRVTATIHLKPDAVPIFRPKRPVAFHLLPTLDEELQRLQGSGIITPVEYSPWAAPIVVARKANGSIRICGDYSTGLNESIEMNNYPIPDPDSLFSRMSNKSVFSHIDLSDAYLQVPMDEESSKLLTIHTPRGLFRFNRLPPGIRSAPGIFQEVVERMLQGIPDVICYFDDISREM